MPSYELSIWYASTPGPEPAQTRKLSAEEVFEYIRPETSFLHDMLNLEGKGIRKLMLEVVDA